MRCRKIVNFQSNCIFNTKSILIYILKFRNNTEKLCLILFDSGQSQLSTPSQLSRVINPFIAIEREQPTLVKSKIVAESCANARGEGEGA